MDFPKLVILRLFAGYLPGKAIRGKAFRKLRTGAVRNDNFIGGVWVKRYIKMFNIINRTIAVINKLVTALVINRPQLKL
jgi:hypothetical protein